jgi:hypothetical protein
MKFSLRSIAFSIALGYTSASVFASWDVVYLSPNPNLFSQASGIGSGQQVGDVDGFAALWNGTAASYVDLSPANSTSSYASATKNGVQVGSAYFTGVVSHAGLWTGSAASWVDLNGALDESFGTNTDGIQQVGWAKSGQNRFACLWTGSAASFVNLTPAGASDAWAYGVGDGQQVGGARINDVQSAGYWSGTAASWVSLGVTGSDHSSFDGFSRAAMWNGTAASFVNLAPGSGYSSAYDVFEDHQVGSAYVDGKMRASLWSGTAASWFDLSTFLPANYEDSNATGIWGDGTKLYISGFARNTVTNKDEAVMWVQAVPEPASTTAIVLGAIGLLARRKRILKK